MRRNSTHTSLGALHPVLFFLFIYGISLFLALFVCRTVYYSLNGSEVASTERSLKTDYGYSAAESTSVAVLK
jgi:hypothetical protein